MNRAARQALTFFEVIAGARVRRCLRDTHVHLKELAGLEDTEIAARCQRLIEVPKLPNTEDKGDAFRWLRGKDIGDQDAEMLAVAAEAFARFPPEHVPPGSRLFEQQLLAATHLLRGTLVQMDTGEGKTFALAAAALALLRTYPKVYVVTANPYLAARDMVNTLPFWSSMGVSVGMGAEAEDDDEPWRARVVYTTLDSLVFRSLTEDLGSAPRLLQWSALLIDEADAILLDKSGRQFQISRTTDDPTKDWHGALQIASELDEEDIEVRSSGGLSAQLTAVGEETVFQLAGLEGRRPSDRLAVLRDVEQAYVAIRVAKEGHDYEVQDDIVVTIDPNSGWHTPSIRCGWVAPLETHLGLRSSPHRSLLHFTDGIAILRRFRHIAGASGTIIEEALDYALLLGLPPASIPPRTPRQDGRLPDVIAVSRERAHEWVVDEIERYGAERPILVATDSTVEAAQIAQLATERDIAGVTVHLVSDETIASERSFELAGQPGTTIISTRVAGRGVDIQLTPEARAAGGAALIAVGHSSQARIDRQLLGRVGRQGDPFTARFVNHPTDPLMSSGAINGRWIEAIIKNVVEEGALEAGLFPRQLAGAQRRVRRWHLQSFAAAVGQGLAREQTTGLLRRWRQSLGFKTQDGAISEEFAGFLAGRFLATNYPALAEPHVTGKLVRTVAEGVVEVAGGPSNDVLELTGRATGQSSEEAQRIFQSYLRQALVTASVENQRTRTELKRQRRRTEEAALDTRLRRFVEDLDETPAGDLNPRRLLQIALAASEGPEAVPVSRELVEAAVAGMDRALSEPDEGGLHSLLATEQAVVCDFDPNHERWWQRSSWQIASETIHRGTRQLETGLDRAQFRASQMANASRSAAGYKSELEILSREVEATLAAELCENLFVGNDDLSALDDLFSNAEHAVSIGTPRTKVTLPALPNRVGSSNDFVEPPLPQGADALIAEYAAAVRGTLPKEPREEDLLVKALRELVGPTGIAPLGSPDVTAERYAAWKRSDVRRKEVPPWRWRFADGYVRGFFAFLNERGLAASLPQGIPQRSRSVLRRIWKKLGTPALGLGALALTSASIVALVLALVPPVSDGPEVGIGLTFLDRLLAAGTLAGGSALAPVLLAMTGGLWARLMRGGQARGDAGLVGVEQEISTLMLVLGSIVVVMPWTSGSPLDLLGSLFLAMALMAASFMIRNGTYRFEQITHVHLVALLAAGFAAFSALPLLIEFSSLVLPVALLAGATNLLSRPLRRARIAALALRVDDDAPMDRESMEVGLPVVGRLSVVPHAFALAFAWTFSCVLVEGGVAVRTAVGAAAYFLTLAAWASLLARSATDPMAWQKRMRANQQTYRHPSPGSSLAAALRAARRRVLFGELVVACVLVALGAWLSASATASLLGQLPLGMATIFVVVTATELGGAFVRTFSAPPLGAAEITSEGEDEGALAKVRALVSQCAKWMSGAIAVILALHEVADLVGLGEFLLDAFDFLKGLF